MQTNSVFYSCDWGTTSFRLRQVCRTPFRILAERAQPLGVKRMLELFSGNPGRAPQVFAETLQQELAALLATSADPSARGPLVISGMASSSIGWKELPYAAVPFPLDGSGLRAERLNWAAPPVVTETFLLSGVATATDLMRGEETEILGLMTTPSLTPPPDQAWLILPGTHAKHVRIERGAVVRWQTYLTGELFEVLSQHSVLRGSLTSAPTAPASIPPLPAPGVDEAAFRAGVRWTRDTGLSGSLFRVRSRSVLDRCSPEANAAFLSGILIGSELHALAQIAQNDPIYLAAAGAFASLYRWAWDALEQPARLWITLPPEVTAAAVPRGHAVFLQTL